MLSVEHFLTPSVAYCAQLRMGWRRCRTSNSQTSNGSQRGRGPRLGLRIFQMNAARCISELFGAVPLAAASIVQANTPLLAGRSAVFRPSSSIVGAP